MTMTPSAEERELNQLESDVWWTEKGHFTSAGFWRSVRLTLGLLATACAAVSTASVVAKSSDWISGLFALASAICAGALTFLEPEKRAQAHDAHGKQLGALRVDIRQYRDLDLPRLPPGDRAAVSAIGQLAAKKAQIEETAPHISDVSVAWTSRRAKTGKFGSGVPKSAD